MFPLFHRRKLPDPTQAELTTADSAIHADVTHRASKIYLTTGTTAGTADAATTADLVKNGAGVGVHPFNTAAAALRSRSSYFVAQAGSTTSTFTIGMQTFGGDAVGAKLVILISGPGTSLAVIGKTIVTLTAAMTNYSVTVATTAGLEYHATITNDPAQGADPGARGWLGAQKVTGPGATGAYAAGYSSILLDPTLWQSNLENFAYVNAAFWSYTTARGYEVSGFAFLRLVTNAASIIVEMGGNGYGTIGAIGTGITAIINGATVQDYKLTADSVLTHQVIPLPGVAGTVVDLYAAGRNLRASAFAGTLYRRILYRTADSLVISRAQNTANAIVICGDSISDGFEANPAASLAWLGLPLQTATGRPVFVDSAGGAFVDNFTSTPFINEEINKLSQPEAPDLILAFTTNDFQNETGATHVTLANFIADLGALADRYHALHPLARIYLLSAWDKTTFERTANGAGHTMDDFRNGAIEIDSLRGSPSWLRVTMTKEWLLFTGQATGDDFCAQAGFAASNVHPHNSGMPAITANLVAALASLKPTLTPASATIGATLSQVFVAAGGTGTGYAFALHANPSGGTINSKTGLYQRGTGAGVDVVQVQDSIGQIATAQVAGVATPIVITGATKCDTSGVINFAAAGGTAPYTWSMTTALGGAVVAGTGVFTASAVAVGWITEIVHVVDAVGNQAARNVVVSKPFDATTLAVAAGTLRLWLEADFGVTVLANGTITQWNDRSLSANHQVMATPVHRPVLETVLGIKGFPCVRYERGFTCAMSSGGNLSAYVTAGGRTMYLLGKAKTVIGTAITGNLCEQNDSFLGETSGYLQFGLVKDGGIWKVFCNDYVSGDKMCMAPDAVAANTPFLAMARKSGGTAAVKLYPNAETTLATGNTSALNTQFMAGGGYAQTRSPHGYLAAALVWDGDIGAAARTAVETYLADKYL